jgi:Flp pilus assembly protein TadD
MRARQFADAERLAADVLKTSPADGAAAAILAHSVLAQNRPRDAVAPLEKALRGKSDPNLETLLGAALGRASRREAAIDQLRRTAARRPAHLPAFQELAGQLAAAERLGEAIAVIESAVALAPDVVDLQLDLARLHLHTTDRSRARAILSQAREAAPSRTDILTALARVLLLDGDYAGAIDAYRHALAYRPDDALTRADLATCLLEMGDRDAGEAALRAAFRSGPQMLGRATHALAASSHGRFFLRPSAAVKFLQG